MSADEIRRLAESRAIFKLHCKSGNLLPRCREWCPSEEAKKCKEAEEIRATLLAYAAMVERCYEMYDKFCMKFSVNSDKAKTNPQFMKVAILLDDMFTYILKGATDERK